MANTLITPQDVANEIYAQLAERAVLVNLVTRDYDPDFSGKQGATVNVRKPTTFTVDEFARPAGRQVQDATETYIPVVLDKLPDVSWAVTTEELTLSTDGWSNGQFNSYSERFIVPAVDAMIEWFESLIIAALQAGVTQEVGAAIVGAAAPRDADYHDTPTALADARKTLNQNKVPRSDRYAVWGPIPETELILTDQFSHAEKKGDTEGLREADMGRVYGFGNFSTSLIPEPAGSPSVGDPTTEVNVAFHRSAVALATRTPEYPMSLPDDKVGMINAGSIGLRVTQEWDGAQKQDVMSVDCLAGSKILDPTRAVLMKGSDATS